MAILVRGTIDPHDHANKVENNMRILLGRIPLIAVSVAVTAGVTLWASAAAAGWPDGASSPPPAIHLLIVPTAEHANIGKNGPEPGQTVQETFAMVQAGKTVGYGFVLLTILTPTPGTHRLYGIQNIEARFSGQGRIELQGAGCAVCSGATMFAITGGTGKFARARGWATRVPVGNRGKSKVTVTFR
jgi:hypothetical protein